MRESMRHIVRIPLCCIKSDRASRYSDQGTSIHTTYQHCYPNVQSSYGDWNIFNEIQFSVYSQKKKTVCVIFFLVLISEPEILSNYMSAVDIVRMSNSGLSAKRKLGLQILFLTIFVALSMNQDKWNLCYIIISHVYNSYIQTMSCSQFNPMIHIMMQLPYVAVSIV